MIFVIDTNIFINLFNQFDMTVFDYIWDPLNKLIGEGRVISVDESYEELVSHYDQKSEVGKWLKDHKFIFQKPSNDETAIVVEIFKNKKFQEGVKEKSLRNGSPEADAFLVAKAKIINGILVTNEKDDKPNSEKIPNICVSQGVTYMTKTEFYRILTNINKGKNENEQVFVCKELGKPISVNNLSSLKEVI